MVKVVMGEGMFPTMPSILEEKFYHATSTRRNKIEERTAQVFRKI